MFRTIECITLILLLTVFNFREGAAQGEQPSDDEINAVAKQLYCPVCENVPLDVCGTRACAQWRDNIREKLVAGWTTEQIKQYFSDQYGVRVLAQPPTQGVNLLFWGIPPIVIIAGWFLVVRFINNLTSKQPKKGISIGDTRTTNGYRERLERDLEKWQ